MTFLGLVYIKVAEGRKDGKRQGNGKAYLHYWFAPF